MAPEQALGRIDQIDARTDQFALATVLYEMLTGQPAFHRQDDVLFVILDRVVNHTPPALPQAQINRAVMRALSKQVAGRYPTLRDFLAAVGATNHTIYAAEGMLQPSPGSVSSTFGEITAPQPHAERKLRQRRRLAIALTAGAVSGLALFALVARAPTPEQGKPTYTAAVSIPKPAVPKSGLPPLADSPNEVMLVGPPRPAMTPWLAQRSSAVAITPDKPAAPVPPVTSSPKRSQSGGAKSSSFWAFRIEGTKSPTHESGIRSCVRENLQRVPGLAEGPVIRLERSGTLQIVDAPAAVYRTNLESCVQQFFVSSPHRLIPQLIKIFVSH